MFEFLKTMPKVESVEKCKGDDFKWFLGRNIMFNVLNGFKVEIKFKILNRFKVEIWSSMF